MKRCGSATWSRGRVKGRGRACWRRCHLRPGAFVENRSVKSRLVRGAETSVRFKTCTPA